MSPSCISYLVSGHSLYSYRYSCYGRAVTSSSQSLNQRIFFQVSVIVTKLAVLCSLRFSQGNELGKTAVMDTTLLVPVQEEKEVRIFFSLQ